MEIQSFVLCGKIHRDGKTGEYTLVNPSANLKAVNSTWPLRTDLCFYLSLRRSAGDALGDFSLVLI